MPEEGGPGGRDAVRVAAASELAGWRRGWPPHLGPPAPSPGGDARGGAGSRVRRA